MAAKKPSKLDKYARDPKAWKAFADHNYAASIYLFESHNPFLIFNAATLGHHCLEMYLKAALICEGCTVFDAKKIKDDLDKAAKLKPSDCAWGHDLVALAKQLAARRTDFDLSEEMTLLLPWHFAGVPTVEKGFEVFNPFFSELRYPQELTMGGVGEDDKLPLQELVERLEPFLEKIK